MARNYGNIAVAIWQDPDFIALSANAQRTYMLIITQHNISSVGTIAITLRRWARMASDTPEECLSNGLAELEAARFIVIDWEEEEVLVRTFVKWDGGHTNPKRITSILSAAKAVRSPIIGPVMSSELNSLGLSHETSYPQVDSHSIADRTPTERPGVVVTYVTTDPTTHTPQQTTRNTHTQADQSATPDKPAQRARYPKAFEEFWTSYPRRVGKDKAHKAWVAAIRQRTTPDEITTAAVRMANDPNLPEEQFIPHPTTWLNRGGWTDAPFPSRNGNGPSRHDENAAAVQRMREREAAMRNPHPPQPARELTR